MSFQIITGKREILLDVQGRMSRLESGYLNFRPADSVMELIPKEGEVSLIWQQRPLRAPAELLPEVIVGSRSSLDDLIAWSASYIHGLGALSANSRLLLSEEAGLLFQTETTPALHHLTALAALIIAEAMVLAEPAAAINTISILAFKSTLSFVYARSLVLGRGIRSKLSDQWERVHRIINPSSRSVNLIPNIVQTCDSVMQLLQNERSEGAITRVELWLKEIAASGEAKPGLVLEILKSIGEFRYESQIKSLLDLTPADRVKLFDELAPKIREQQQRPRMERAFAIAAMASLCRPGLLQQLSFLRDALVKLHENLPEAIILLGVIQGLHRKNDVLEYGEGLGRRIIRETMHKDWIADRPTSDISLIELEILAKGNSLPSLRTNDPSYIVVDIQPGIFTIAKWHPRVSPEQRSFAGDLPLALPEYDPVEELTNALRRASEIWALMKKDLKNPVGYRKRKTKQR